MRRALSVIIYDKEKRRINMAHKFLIIHKYIKFRLH
jgi:hypothetical protein